jgi:glycosyltransferase involved in cell wall biosynthesis
MRILVLTKRQYTNKDLLSDRYGRLYELPRELARLGHVVTGVCLSYRSREQGHLQGREIDQSPVEWHSWNLGRTVLPGLIRYLQKLDLVCREFQPDIILACSDALQIINGVRRAQQTGIPCVVDLYDNFESFTLTRLPGLLPLFKQAVRRAAGVICVSHPLQEYIESNYLPKGRVKTIGNGVTTGLFRPMNRNQCRQRFNLPLAGRLIGTGGTLGASRDTDTLFAGFEQLTAHDPELHLVLAGQPEPGTVLPAGRQVHYLGILASREMPFFFNSLDVGLICNRDNLFGRYCFPQKMAEMAACRIPLVAARVGEVATLLRNCPQSLYTAGDSASLIRAVSGQLKNPLPPDLVISSWQELALLLEELLIQEM